jgi:hypothetical protein
LINDKFGIIAGPTRVLHFQISSRRFAQWAGAIILCSRNTASAEKSDGVIQAHSERLYITNPTSVPKSARHKAEIQIMSVIILIATYATRGSIKAWKKILKGSST